jgi:hypothetical protein
MRGRIFLGGLALAAALSVGGEASACIPLAVTYVGERPPSAREMAAARARQLRFEVRLRRPLAEAELARGVDAAGELAKMLVPNIRPVPIVRSDCGVENEIDSADGEEGFEDLLAGTYLAGYGNEFAYMVWGYEGETLGRACNAEFRDRFAAHLRSRLDARILAASYLFLRSRWGGSGELVWRLVAFENRTRRPPVRWDTSYRPEIERWAQRTDEGRALQQAADDFWRESAPLLGEPGSACPAAVARWPTTQARILADIETHYPVARRVRGERR